jgi:hypothetical protein
MFELHKEIIRTNQAIRYWITQNDQPISFHDFLNLLNTSADFRTFFIQALTEIPFPAYHWETPALTRSSQNQKFEYVATKSPSIDLPPKPGPFRSYFNARYQNQGMAVFPNLGGDATLIAPSIPEDPNRNYSHLARFTEQASTAEQHSFWEVVGKATMARINDTPIWLNTAGGGVAWLHVRLDSRPKYYLHGPYRQE